MVKVWYETRACLKIPRGLMLYVNKTHFCSTITFNLIYFPEEFEITKKAFISGFQDFNLKELLRSVPVRKSAVLGFTVVLAEIEL